jgi:hypothetical protein
MFNEILFLLLMRVDDYQYGGSKLSRDFFQWVRKLKWGFNWDD